MNTPPSILLHAGAGALSDELVECGAEIRQELTDVLLTAGGALERGDDALSVAIGAVQALEAFGLFNAGYGSALCSDGSVEMSAALMRGSDRASGAVAGVRSARHPIRAAELVLESDQVLMIGQAADRLASAAGIERWENSRFVTERQLARLKASPIEPDRGTVGAVCRDQAGRLVAATSTGGIMDQPPGRVGDSPLLGSGTWADERVAISCTGDGEAFIRCAAAHTVAVLIEQGVSVAEASRQALAEVGTLGGTGGLIALGADGEIALQFTTAAMPRGAWRPQTGAEVWID